MSDFSFLICEWYKRNKRELPWRETNNPYHIWLSEVILQQTRVIQGKSYYLKFIEKYPTIHHLADANEQEILNDWQGLGYYSRARNLHLTAKIISNEYNGNFPKEYEEIIKLKGIGSYTAAAIASFAYNLPYSVLDGNVFRILSRFFDIKTPINSLQGKKEFSNLAQELLPKNNSSEYNQAIMEFGAMYCVPQKPNCLVCELNHKCLSYKNKTVQIRPVKIKKLKIKKRYFHYFLITNKKELILRKRVEEDIWKHLFEFPKIEFLEEKKEQEVQKEIFLRYKLNAKNVFKVKKHILSHQHLFSLFWVLEVDDLSKFAKNKNEIIVKIEDLSEYPLPRLIDRFLEDHSQKLF